MLRQRFKFWSFSTEQKFELARNSVYTVVWRHFSLAREHLWPHSIIWFTVTEVKIVDSDALFVVYEICNRHFSVCSVQIFQAINVDQVPRNRSCRYRRNKRRTCLATFKKPPCKSSECVCVQIYWWDRANLVLLYSTHDCPLIVPLTVDDYEIDRNLRKNA